MFPNTIFDPNYFAPAYFGRPAPGGLINLSPAITTLYLQPVPERMRAVSLISGQKSVVSLNLLDLSGNPVDLTQYSFPAAGAVADRQILVSVTEAVNLGGTVATPANPVTGEVTQPKTGLVQFVPPSAIMSVPGVYLCEVGAFAVDAAGNQNLIFSNQIYLFVQRGLFASPGQTINPNNAGPPTLQEIRLALRDTPSVNRLIDQYEFDVAEICDTLVRAVIHWNTAPPMINAFYDTTTFPYRFQWLGGCASLLMRTAATWYRRNHLPYQTGQLAVDDLNKFKEYEGAADQRWKDWTEFVTRRKAQINLESMYGTISSVYANHW